MARAWLELMLTTGVLFLAAEVIAPTRVQARAETPATPTIAEKTAGAQKLAGYFNLYWDAKQGKLWLEIDKWGSEFLYQSGLPAGIGSNDIGLDRGQLGRTRIVRFERSGPGGGSTRQHGYLCALGVRQVLPQVGRVREFARRGRG